MNWLLETLTEPSMIQAVAVISIVAAVGVYFRAAKDIRHFIRHHFCILRRYYGRASGHYRK